MSNRRTTDIPPPLDDDLEDVHVALSAASTLWRRGEGSEALKWLRRAAGAAAESDADVRAVELFKAAADVASSLEDKKAPKLTATPPPSDTIEGQARQARQAQLAHDLDFDDGEETVIRPETRVRRALMAIDPDYARRTSYPSDSDREEDDSVSNEAEAAATSSRQDSAEPAEAAASSTPSQSAIAPPPRLPAVPAQHDRDPSRVSATPRESSPQAPPGPREPKLLRPLPLPMSQRERARPTLVKPDSSRTHARRAGAIAASHGSRRRLTPARRLRGDSTTPPGGIRPSPRSVAPPPLSSNPPPAESSASPPWPPRPADADDPLAVTQKRPAADANIVRPARALPGALLPALRVSVRRDEQGELQLAFIGPDDAIEAGSAAALLVAPTEEDARILTEIYQASQSKP